MVTHAWVKKVLAIVVYMKNLDLMMDITVAHPQIPLAMIVIRMFYVTREENFAYTNSAVNKICVQD